MSQGGEVFSGKGTPPSEHPFDQLQPQQADEQLIQRYTLGVGHHGFHYTSHGVQQFVVESTRGGDGLRRPHMKYDHLAGTDADSLSFRGVLGEQIARIVIDEFLTRNAGTLNFEWCSPLRGTDWQTPEPLVQGSTFDLWNERNYNLIVLDDMSIVGEFDGGWEYMHPTGKGVIILESKTGNLNGLSVEGQDNRESLQRRYIGPLHDLFPDHRKDLLLMAPSDVIFKPHKYDDSTATRIRSGRTFKDSVSELSQYMQSQSIGFIGMDFPLARTTLMSHAERAFKISEGVRCTSVPRLRDQGLQGNEWFVDRHGNFHLRSDGELQFLFGNRKHPAYHIDHAKRKDFRNG